MRYQTKNPCRISVVTLRRFQRADSEIQLTDKGICLWAVARGFGSLLPGDEYIETTRTKLKLLKLLDEHEQNIRGGTQPRQLAAAALLHVHPSRERIAAFRAALDTGGYEGGRILLETLARG